MRHFDVGGLAVVLVVASVLSVAAEPIAAVTTTNQLIFFSSGTPGALIYTKPLGPFSPGENLQEFDGRGGFALIPGVAVSGTTGRFVLVDVFGGAVLGAGTNLPFTPGSTAFGVDLDPVTGRLRVVSDQGDNFSIDINIPSVRSDPPLSSANIVALAYDRNFVGSTSTTLYGINALTDSLVTVDPATGAVTPVGPLGVDTASTVGFDISATGVAYAALAVGGSSKLYTIDLATGAAKLVGPIGDGTLVVRGLTVLAGKPIVVGAGPGGSSHVRVLDSATGGPRLELNPVYGFFGGGVRVAVCDVNGDGTLDIVVGAGPGGGPHIRVFDGITGNQLPGSIGSFFAFTPGFTGGVYVACTDVDLDGKADIIVGAGPGGGPHVRIFSGATGAEIHHPLASFFAFSPGFLGGVSVGAAP